MGFKKIQLIILLTIIIFGLAQANVSSAGVFDQIIGGFSKTGGEAGYTLVDGRPKHEFTQAWAIYANGLAIMMAVFFTILSIFAGYLWMTAQGNEEQVARAKKVLIGAVIGLSLVLASRIIAELAFDILKGTLPIAQEG